MGNLQVDQPSHCCQHLCGHRGLLGGGPWLLLAAAVRLRRQGHQLPSRRGKKTLKHSIIVGEWEFGKQYLFDGKSFSCNWDQEKGNYTSCFCEENLLSHLSVDIRWWGGKEIGCARLEIHSESMYKQARKHIAYYKLIAGAEHLHL